MISRRAGFLTQGSFLALTGNADGSNPVRRCKFVYEKMLCRTLPPPPPNVPNPKPASAGGTTRQRFAEHSQQACAKGCHGVMDPIGFAFENYDGIGKYRTMDNGQAVDSTSVLVKFTYAGDANLDGTINIDDYGRIDSSVSQSGTVFGWFNGDFNYDGKIDIDDYGIIDGNVSEQGQPI